MLSLESKCSTLSLVESWIHIPHFNYCWIRTCSLKALRQLVWRLLLRSKNVLDWKKCPISMFSEVFSPYKHVLAALFRHCYSSKLFCTYFDWTLEYLSLGKRSEESTKTKEINFPTTNGYFRVITFQTFDIASFPEWGKQREKDYFKSLNNMIKANLTKAR